MRQLTLLGFLSEYVRLLSECNSLNIHKLINEVYGGNYRLREPLFLYCHYNCKSDILLKYLNDADIEEYTFVVTLIKNNQTDDLPNDFLKVLNSYRRKIGMKDNDDNIKRLMLDKIIMLKEQKKVTNYHIYKALNINAGNFNDFVKNRKLNRLSLDKSREIYNYLQSL